MTKSFKESFIKSRKRKPRKRLVALRLPIDIEKELIKLQIAKDTTLTEVIIKALRFALELPEDQS